MNENLPKKTSTQSFTSITDIEPLIIFLSKITIPCSKCGFDFKLIYKYGTSEIFIIGNLITVPVIYGGDFKFKTIERLNGDKQECQGCCRSDGNILDRLYCTMISDVDQRLDIKVNSLYKFFNVMVITLLKESDMKINIKNYIDDKLIDIYKILSQVTIGKIEMEKIAWCENIVDLILEIRVRRFLSNCEYSYETILYDKTNEKVNDLIYKITDILIRYISDSVRDVYRKV